MFLVFRPCTASHNVHRVDTSQGSAAPSQESRELPDRRTPDPELRYLDEHCIVFFFLFICALRFFDAFLSVFGSSRHQGPRNSLDCFSNFNVVEIVCCTAYTRTQFVDDNDRRAEMCSSSANARTVHIGIYGPMGRKIKTLQ